MILKNDLDVYYNSLTGEIKNTKRYEVKGNKMYIATLMDMHDTLTKTEFKLIVNAFDDSKIVDKDNILLVPFRKITDTLDTRRRSEMKKRLLDSNIVLIYNKRIMFNPFIFCPRDDKNYNNHKFMIQRVWTYLNDDVDKNYDSKNYENTYTETERYINRIFDKQ